MTASKKPRVSLCLLTYNRANVLDRSINSLLSQDFEDFELIINDDCSPDHTAQVCEAFAKKDPRVKYFRNEKNLRYAGNQNIAMDRAQGEFIAYVHDGDIYHPFMVREWVEALDKHPTAALVFNAVNTLGEHGFEAATFHHGYPPLVDGKTLCKEMIFRADSPIYGIVMLRLDVLRSYAKFDLSLPVLADVDMWLRILANHDAAYVDRVLYDIMPREVGHINRDPIVNWKIQEERDRIYFINLARFYGGWDSVPSAEKRQLQMSRFKENTRAVLRCIKGLDLKRMSAGVQALLSGYPFGAVINLKNALAKL